MTKVSDNLSVHSLHINIIKGNFKAGNWGTFPVFFNFHQNADGKFDRLDIGQAKK
ncbi:hypothetical protein D3C87_298410 [compost metagenome]